MWWPQIFLSTSIFFIIRLQIHLALLRILFFKNDTKKINIRPLLRRYEELLHSCNYKLNLVSCAVRFSQWNGGKGYLTEALVWIPLTLERSKNSRMRGPRPGVLCWAVPGPVFARFSIFFPHWFVGAFYSLDTAPSCVHCKYLLLVSYLFTVSFHEQSFGHGFCLFACLF